MRVRRTRQPLKTTVKPILNFLNCSKKRKIWKRRVIHLSKQSLAFSSRSLLMRVVSTSRFARRLVHASSKIRPVKCLRRRIWSICGICSKSTSLNLMMALSALTTISSSSFHLVYHQSADNFSAQAHSSNLKETNLAALRLFHSSTMWLEKSICSKLAYKSRSMTQAVMDT